MNIIKHKNLFLAIAILLVGASITSIFVFGLKPGMEFKGGTMWQIKVSANRDEVKNFLESGVGLKNFTVYPEEETKSLIIRSEEISESDHQKDIELLKGKFGNVEELRFDSIGATVGNELKGKATTAILIAILAIALYIAFVFRKVSYPIKPWQYGVSVVISLIHDVAIPAGVFAILNLVKGIEIDINFLTALLVIMGFSVHDTVVVFDRIRENLLKSGRRGGMTKKELGDIINLSVKQTLKRSIFTSLTVMMVLAFLLVLGPVSLQNFVLALFIGIFFGTYSSIFVASPILYLFYKPNRVDK